MHYNITLTLVILDRLGSRICYKGHRDQMGHRNSNGGGDGGGMATLRGLGNRMDRRSGDGIF